MSIKILNENLNSGDYSKLYYIFGEEEYLKNHYYSLLKEKIVTDFVEFNFIEFDAKTFTQLDFSNAVNSYPVMTDKKLVTVVDFDNSLLKKDFVKDMKALFSSMPDYCVVVFFDSHLKTTGKTNELLNTIGEWGGVAVDVKRPEIKSLVGWANRHFKSHNKTISSENIQYIIELAGRDMMVLSGEINKLCSFVKGTEITKDDINKTISRSIETNIYELANAFCNKNYDEVYDIVMKLYKQGEEDIVIANLFYRAFTDMWKAKKAIAIGKSSNDFAADFKIFPSFNAPKAMKNSKFLTKTFLDKAILLLEQLDYNLKRANLNKKELLLCAISELISLRESYEQN